MQVIDEGGTARELEPYEVAALEAAQLEHFAGQGVTPQYSEQKRQRILMESLANQASIPAVQAVRMVDAYPEWQAGTAYESGFRVRWSGYLWRVVQDHTSSDDALPSETPALYAKVVANAEGEGAPDWQEQAVYSKGDRVVESGKVWVSTAESNTLQPGSIGWAEAPAETE